MSVDLNGTTALNPAKQPIGFAGSVQEMITIKRWMQFCLDDLKVELDGLSTDKLVTKDSIANAALAYSFISSYLEVQMEKITDSMGKPRKVS